MGVVSETRVKELWYVTSHESDMLFWFPSLLPLLVLPLLAGRLALQSCCFSPPAAEQSEPESVSCQRLLGCLRVSTAGFGIPTSSVDSSQRCAVEAAVLACTETTCVYNNAAIEYMQS